MVCLEIQGVHHEQSAQQLECRSTVRKFDQLDYCDTVTHLEFIPNTDRNQTMYNEYISQCLIRKLIKSELSTSQY